MGVTNDEFVGSVFAGDMDGAVEISTGFGDDGSARFVTGICKLKG